MKRTGVPGREGTGTNGARGEGTGLGPRIPLPSAGTREWEGEGGGPDSREGRECGVAEG